MNKLYKKIDIGMKFVEVYKYPIEFSEDEKLKLNIYIPNIIETKKLILLQNDIYIGNCISYTYTDMNKFHNECYIISAISKLQDDYYLLSTGIYLTGRFLKESNFLCDNIEGLYSCINNEMLLTTKLYV